MSNGAERASGSATYRLLRELGSRTQATYAAMREPGELVVAQYFSRGAIETAHGSGRPRTTPLDAEEMALLLRDARCLSKSWHSNIARVRHVDLAGPVLTIASDLVDGTTLEDLLTAARAERVDEREPILPFPILVRVLVDVLTGVHALHGLRDGLNTAVGAIHGELCPANVVIGKDGVTRLVDVLRSRPVHVPETSPGAGYAAPEALAPLGTEDPRADVYSVGAILWEGLTGRPPQGAERATPIIHKSSPFARLADVAMRALAVEQAVRFASAAEMSAELRKIAGTRLATGTAVAARNFELAGDRMRMRKAVLDPATSGMRRRTSERTIAAALAARDTRDRREDVADHAADTAPNPVVSDAAAGAYDFEDDDDDDDALPGPRESSPDVEMEVAMEIALQENAMRERLLALAPQASPQAPWSARPPPPDAQASVAETPGDFVIPIHVTESHDAPTGVQSRHIAPKHRNAAIAVVAVAMALLAALSFFVLRARLDAAHDGEPRGTTATQPASPPPASPPRAAPPPMAEDVTTSSVPPARTPPQAPPSAGGRASATRPAPRAPTPVAPAPAKPKKSIYDPDAL